MATFGNPEDEQQAPHQQDALILSMGLLILLILLCFFALRFAWIRLHNASVTHRAPTMQRPRAGRHGDPEADDEGIEIVSLPADAAASPFAASAADSGLDMYSRCPMANAQGTALFAAQYSPLPFPTDSATLRQMQDSPTQWHFLNPGFALPEFHLLLSHLVQCDPHAHAVTLFADNEPGAPKRIQSTARPRALTVQTRLPVPIPPADEQDVVADHVQDNMEAPHPAVRVASNLYFEVRVVSMGVVDFKHPLPGVKHLTSDVVALEPTVVAIGLAQGPFPPFRLPGWTRWSVGYHSHTGQLFLGANSSNGYQYGDPFGPGDVVGVGLDTVARCVFFTLNGNRLPIAVELPVGTRHAVFPTVGATGPCTLEYNFGTHPFLWDGRGELAVEREQGGVDEHDGEGPRRVTEQVEFVGYALDVLPAYEA